VAVVNTPEDAARLFTYSVANGEVTITGLTDEAYAGALVIPETIEGTPVTSIGNGAFSGCDGLTSVIIPEGVLSIENRAFWSCQGLTYVLIPSTVTRIGDWALGGCPNLTSLMIPQGVVSIGDRAFWGARSLTEFVVDAENSHYGTIDGLLCSKDGAELICAPSGLTSVIIPEGINSIGCSAFNGFGGLTSVTIPSSVTEIKWAAFDGCSGLTSIIIPSSVAVIEDRAFAYCSSLTSIVIPDGITTIGEEMFLSCSRLRSVSIPRSVCTIESSAFYGCYSSLSLEFEGMPPSVVSVGFGFPSANGTYRAEYASEWEAVIDANGQWNNLTMTCVETPEENDPLYYVIDLSGGTSATSYPVTTLSAPPAEGWTDEYKTTKLVLLRIEAGSFQMGGSYNVTISQPFYMGVFEITQKQYELVTGSNLSSYTGDARPVENVSWNSIRGNSDIFNWPSVTTVNANSFMGKIRAKTGLTFDLPTEAQWEYACRAGTTSDYNNGGSTEADLQLLGRYNGNQNDGRGGYSQHTVVGSYLPNAWGLYDMHGNVWEWCLDWYGNLSSSTDPIGSTSGPYRVKRGGSWYNSADYCTLSYRYNFTPSHANDISGFRLACPVAVIDEPETPEADVRLFTYSVANGEVTITGLTDDAYAGALVIPGTIEGTPVTKIGDRAFYRCNGLTSVTFPNSITSVGYMSFFECNSLTAVCISDMTAWCSIRFGDFSNPLYCAHNLYLNDELVTELVFPEGIATIGYNTFEGCESLTSIVIPDSVTTIGFGALRNCSGLTQITIPASVTSIEEDAFEGRCGLTIVNFEGLPPRVNLPMFPIANGTYRAEYASAWEAVIDANGQWNNLTMTCEETPEENDALYYVIDLSGGASATSYPVTTLSAPPARGWTDEYKTTKLVLRRIEAGTFLMSESYNVTISQPFYMGVFEVTQKQYELVTGSNPSNYTGDARPVECVTWSAIRGNSNTYNWPSVTTVSATSFMGKLRAKTGLTLDLPTEAQWEYACRAGTTSAYNNGGNSEADLALLGRYSSNMNDGRGGYLQHTKVGSYLPNLWGLYDMHGNVWEWCLDWSGDLSSSTDPKGPTSGSGRVLRGGGLNYNADYCTSSFRRDDNPSRTFNGRGFRLACPAGL
jgi:formylglycine-generating enzyme required for sulfatase activity